MLIINSLLLLLAIVLLSLSHVLSQCIIFTQSFPSVKPPTFVINSDGKNQGITAQANATLLSDSPNTTWVLDSGASHQVTPDIANLFLHSPYDGTTELIVGDCKGLHISHIGSITLKVNSKSSVLNNILHTPSSRNIIYISQFCYDNNAFIEFLSIFFFMKDIPTSKVLLQGPVKQGVYEVLLESPFAFSSQVQPRFLTLYHRLGHSSLNVFKHLCSHFSVSISHLSSCTYNTCNINKMHRLPFVKSSITSTAPLQLFTQIYELLLSTLSMVINTMLYL